MKLILAIDYTFFFFCFQMIFNSVFHRVQNTQWDNPLDLSFFVENESCHPTRVSLAELVITTQPKTTSNSINPFLWLNVKRCDHKFFIIFKKRTLSYPRPSFPFHFDLESTYSPEAFHPKKIHFSKGPSNSKLPHSLITIFPCLRKVSMI